MCRTWVVGAVLAMALCGCAALNPKNWTWPTANRAPKNPPEQTTTLTAPTEPSAADSAAAGRTMSHRGNGVLAGQVMDAYYQRRPYSLIQVSLADGGESPRDVQTDSQGYFVIQGLKPGQRYKLLAKSRLGEKVLSGVTYATPPNVVVNIIVREEFQDDSPSRPPANSVRRPEENAQPVGHPQSWHVPTSEGDKPWSPAAGPDSKPPVLAVQPSSQPNYSLEKPSSPPRVPPLHVPSPNLAGQRSQSSSTTRTTTTANLPLAQLANPVPWPGAVPPSSTTTSLPALPNCRLVANRIEDFGLYDIHGQPFRFRDAPARLTLLDFWGTWCRPCLNALPHLVELQHRYGPQGLQVIGIAYEDGPIIEQQQRLNFVRQRFGLNYRILLGNGENCPVKSQLHVQSFPTLVLLDSQGHILWRSEGLDAQRLAQLEEEIRRRLN